MYKKIINHIKQSMPNYDSTYQVVEMKELDNDYIILYRAYGKSGIDKGLLSKIICDEPIEKKQVMQKFSLFYGDAYHLNNCKQLKD